VIVAESKRKKPQRNRYHEEFSKAFLSGRPSSPPLRSGQKLTAGSPKPALLTVHQGSVSQPRGDRRPRSRSSTATYDTVPHPLAICPERLEARIISPNLAILNSWSHKKREVEPGPGEETTEQAGPVLYPPRPGLDEGRKLAEVALGQTGQPELAPGLTVISPASDTRLLLPSVTVTTGVWPRRPRVRPDGGLRPWSDLPSKTSQAPRSAAVLLPPTRSRQRVDGHRPAPAAGPQS
jgi:hypothetical protein